MEIGSRHRTISNRGCNIVYLAVDRRISAEERQRGGIERRMNGAGNVIRGPVIMTPLITDNYLGYRPRGVISTGPSPARQMEVEREEREERGETSEVARSLKSIRGTIVEENTRNNSRSTYRSFVRSFVALVINNYDYVVNSRIIRYWSC